MYSLRWKLGGALFLVVLVAIGIMAYLINQNTAHQFEQYIQGGNMAYSQRLVNNLAQHYAVENSWLGVQDILTLSLRSNSDRLVLSDSSGKIVADTANQATGENAAAIGLVNGLPIQVSGQTAGTLYVVAGGGAGRGFMGGKGMSVPGYSSPTAILAAETDFLGKVNSYIWIAGIIAVVIALVMGIFLTRQLTRPLKALKEGAYHIAEGDLAYRVKVNSKDEIGEVARSFNEMAVKLDNSELSRRRLVSDVAHELRTPLTIIEGTVDGILDGVFLPDKEHLGSIQEQTALLTRLVSDLRELSLAESGQMKLECLPTDLVDLVGRKLNQFQIKAREKNIGLNLDTTAPVPEVLIDPGRIEQVIANLLSNAIRHTPVGGLITTSIKTAKDIPDYNNKPLVVLSVADNGEGIPPEHLPHIFERFYRVETSRSRNEGGAGLGLAIVKQMVQAHGGKVTVESQVGQGSIFSVYLPAAV